MLRSMMSSKMSSSVRNDLKLIFESSVNAVKPDSLIKQFIEFNENKLLVKNLSQKVEKSVCLENRDIYILGAGKAVLKMCEEFLNQFDEHKSRLNCDQLSLIRGVLSVPIGAKTESPLFAKYNVMYRSGALNNMPDIDSLDTTQQIVDLIKSAKSYVSNKSSDNKPLIISFISGGGSALLSLPKPGLGLDQKCAVISKLVKSGATINQLNSVRRCLSRVKCGKLAQLATGLPNSVQMMTFIISDIIDDPIELIASGPTVVFKSDSLESSEKALKVLNDLNIKVNKDIKNIIQLEDKEFDSYKSDDNILDNIIIGNNRIALNVAQTTAVRLGYKVVFFGNAIKGEARDVAIGWTQTALNFKETEEDLKNYRGICWIGGGETTVDMKSSNTGLGGRCQEMCLSFYRNICDFETNTKYFMLCAGTDGQDGPTDVAGVIAENISKSNNSSEQLLRQSDNDLINHNSYNFFKNNYNNWFVKTGITGTNVMDIYCLIKSFK